jgi:uracil-DNA glycosylase
MLEQQKEKKVQIEESWYRVLKSEFDKPYFTEIIHFLKKEIKNGKEVFPPGSLIFNAFNSTPFSKVKVVILGQDPYHGKGQAMGLSFSVPKGVRVPPSLKNIYKELAEDVKCKIPENGDLSSWANQGVFLLNAILTVESTKAGSHKKIGWHIFTDRVIQKLSEEKTGLVFMLWGNFAKGKKIFIDESKHTILEAAHPSPLARNAYAGSSHFSKTNQVLIAQGQKPIEWQI